jgi:polyisoprenoid-binding protein YceI
MSHKPLLSIVFGTLLVMAGWMAAPVRLSLAPESKLWIEGTSTMHDWTCRVGQFSGSLEAASEAVEQIGSAGVSVPVRGLECKNGTMNKKALEALKAKDHPSITYQLSRADLQGVTSQEFELKTTGRLTIAGTTRDVAMTVKGKPLGDGSFRFTGSTPLKMSDFGIDPPTAMLGTMKTGNQIVVHFDVVAR